MKLGDGLWRTIGGLGSYRLDFADVPGGQAGALVTVQENGSTALMALRLKVRGGRISEVETILARKGELPSLQMQQVFRLQTPLDLWIASQCACAGAGDVGQYPVIRTGQWKLLRVGGEDLDLRLATLR